MKSNWDKKILDFKNKLNKKSGFYSVKDSCNFLLGRN